MIPNEFGRSLHRGCRRPRAAAAAGAALVLFGGALAVHLTARRGDGFLDAVGREVGARDLGPRLSISHADPRCSAHPPDGGGAAAPCPEPGLSRSVLHLSTRAAGRLQEGADPEALHALALVDLFSGDSAGIALQRAISYLDKASRLAGRPAPVLGDLSAALLVRAERMQLAKDLFEAVEAAEAAVELEPRHAPALFNLALALDRLGQDAQAREAWESFLAADSTTAWAAKARERRAALAAATPAPDAPSPDAPPAELQAYAERAPQQARMWGMDSLLGEWGAARLGSDTATAERRLRAAGALAEGLARRGGDATLGDAVAAIRAHAADPAISGALARAHRDYASGLAAYWYREGSMVDAERRLRAASGTTVSPALREWAASYHAATLVYLNRGGSRARGERLLREMAARADTVRHPALAARIQWNLATTLARSNRYEEAAQRYERAAALFGRAGEREHQGAVVGMRAEVLFKSGETEAAFAAAHHAFMLLRPYRSSRWLHNLHYAAAAGAEENGLWRTALRIQGEGIHVAARAQPDALAEAYLRRAHLRGAVGLADEAAADLERSRTLLQTLPPDARGWAEADLRAAQARTALSRDPAGAVAALDSVVAYFGTGASGSRLLLALLQRAEAHLALGSAEAAAADLDRAVAVLDQQRAAMSGEPRRAALVDRARQVFDLLVMLQVNAGRPDRALAYLERARTSLPAGDRRGRGTAPAVAPDEVAVEYALIGDTLLTWTLSREGLHLVRRTVDGEDLARLVERARSTLELGSETAASRPLLQALYDRLVRPVQARLGPEGTPLALVADGELGDVPFAALWDGAGERYLVQRHPLRFLPSLGLAAGRAPPARAPPPRGVLLVADPAFDPRAFPTLDRLPGAADEVDLVARQYPGAVVLRHASAAADAVRGELAGAAIVHYAGHAVFDDDRPESSFLVLAPPRSGGSARLTADEIRAMELPGVRLVVLSACQTLRSRRGRSGGFAGLTGAFLAAGAGGVVGTLWRVEDDGTRALMDEFHRAYRASGTGAAALREAQLRLLRSPDPALRNPAAWGAFRYTGY